MPRLDEEIVRRGLLPTRSRARDAILRGAVTVDGTKASRPAASVSERSAIAVDDETARYVSRAALKLRHALDAFGYDPAGLSILDLGASTGGFTQILLERGALRVFAIDVGHGQLAPQLGNDPRVLARQGLNARDLARSDLDGPVEAIVSDVSFISQRLALPPALGLAVPGAFAVVLAKPQFEVGREHLSKAGVVRDPAIAEAAARDLADWLDRQPGWTVDRLVPSPIAGGSGNREFLIGARKQRAAPAVPSAWPSG
ncbi:MAG: TlyA family RNA methyltransferase [Bauldia sp.]